MKTVCTIVNVDENTCKENIKISLIKSDNVLGIYFENEVICLLWSDIEKLIKCGNKKENLTNIVRRVFHYYDEHHADYDWTEFNEACGIIMDLIDENINE